MKDREIFVRGSAEVWRGRMKEEFYSGVLVGWLSAFAAVAITFGLLQWLQ